MDETDFLLYPPPSVGLPFDRPPSAVLSTLDVAFCSRVLLPLMGFLSGRVQTPDLWACGWLLSPFLGGYLI